MEEIRIHHREKQANENVSHGCSTRYVPCQQEQSENVMAHRHHHHHHIKHTHSLTLGKGKASHSHQKGVQDPHARNNKGTTVRE
jgi:hypothetical protein